MNKNTKTALILGGLCAIALIVALVIFIPKNNAPDVPPLDTQGPTQDVENNTEDTTNNDELSSNVPIVNQTRIDGNIKVPMIANGTKIGEINLVVKESKFNFPIDELIALGVATFDKQDSIYIYKNDDTIYKVGQESIVILVQNSKNDGETADTNNKESKEPTETTIDSKGYIVINEKDYLTEDAFLSLFNGYVNNKAASIGKVDAAKNTLDIEEFLRNETKTEASKEDISKIAAELGGLSNAFTVNSTSTIKENFVSSEIRDILSFSMIGENNIITSFKNDNQFLIIFNNNVASAIMNSILGSVSEHDLYTNVRVLITLDTEGKITELKADTYYLFDSRDIYYYITMMN